MTHEEKYRISYESQSCAFPVPEKHISEHTEYGLTKREYFAAMALQGFVAATRYDSDSDIEYFAQIAVQAADALIAELNK